MNFASAVDFHGYFRTATNYNGQGGNTYCPGSGTGGHMAGRLGAECDFWMEITLDQEVFNKANNKFAVHTMIAYGNTAENWDFQGNDWQATDNSYSAGWNGQRITVKQFWAEYQMPSGITLWGGKRYYKRKDVHIMDYYYLNDSGNGFGIENIALNGLGNLSFALMKMQTTNFGGSDESKADNHYKLDARWDGIPLWSEASLDIDLIYSWDHYSDEQKAGGAKTNNGFLGMIEYVQGNFFGGFNKLSYTFGKGALNGIGSFGNHGGANVVPYHQRGTGHRILDWGVIEQAKWNLGYSFMFGHMSNDDKDGDTDWGKGWNKIGGNYYSVVLRPSFKWSTFTSTVMEIGHYNGDYNGVNGRPADASERETLSKITLGQQWTPDSSFWSRPSLMLFASWITGNQMDHKFSNGDSHEFIFGFRTEAWW